MARPTKYNEEIAQQILKMLEDGCHIKDVAAAVKISWVTLYKWISCRPDFAARVEQAEGAAAVKMTSVITKSAQTDWRAALEWLKRRRREEWGDNFSFRNASDDDIIAIAEGRLPGDTQARPDNPVP